METEIPLNARVIYDAAGNILGITLDTAKVLVLPLGVFCCSLEEWQKAQR